MNTGYLSQPKPKLHNIQLEIMFQAMLQDHIQVLIMVSCGLLVTVTKPHHHNIICYHLNFGEAFHYLTHFLLEHFRGRGNSIRDLFTLISSKWSVEDRKIRRGLIQPDMPQSISGIQDREPFSSIETTCYFLNGRQLTVLALDGLVQLFGIQTDTYLTISFWYTHHGTDPRGGSHHRSKRLPIHKVI